MGYHIHFEDEKTPQLKGWETEEQARTEAESERPGARYWLVRMDGDSGAGEIIE